ncbi:MAG TPA: hypothetical protein PLW77_06880 [Bacteroidales bacterium]|nr:hypothetical protein [Bacteroidales bacterium]HQB21456.1 hypothetical protein [Bacteroidales bacterium]
MKIYQSWYHPDINITILDIVLILVILFFAYVYGSRKSSNNFDKAEYKFFKSALIYKILVSVVFALTVLFFYPGDSFSYFQSINSFSKLFFENPQHYFNILVFGNKPEFHSYFNANTGYPPYYMWRDANSIFVARFYSIFMFLTYRSYLLSTIIASLIGFTGLWKFYKTLCKIYPGIEQKFIFAIMYMPSLFFWTSGIMKDTLTVSAIGWIIYAFYELVIIKKIKVKYILIIIISSIIIINVKAYVLLALAPGLFIWAFFGQMKAIKSKVLKFLLAPAILGILLLVFSLLMRNASEYMGVYGDIEATLTQASVVQQDLLRYEQYGQNYYDIGKFEATPMGVLKKFPEATISGIYRPFLWEAGNPFVLLAALESLFLLVYLLYVAFKTKIIRFFKIVFSDPLLIFSLSFVIIFSFGIGLASANFGALARYKAPMLPFYVASLFIIEYIFNKKKSRK